MSFTLHPQVTTLQCPIPPSPSCERDLWLGGNGGVYGGRWAACRDIGNRRLLNFGSHRCLFYQFNPAWYEQGAVSYPYSHGQIAQNIARLFWYVEGRMGWEDRTRIQRTQYGQVLVAVFSGGWFQSPTTQWLATLLLRLGGHCAEGRSLEWVLHQHQYGHETIPAIHRFLQGYQHYTGCMREGKGWHMLFGLRNWEQVCRLLIDRREVEQRAFELASQDNHQQSGERYWLTACSQFQVDDSQVREAQAGTIRLTERIPRLALRDYNLAIAA